MHSQKLPPFCFIFLSLRFHYIFWSNLGPSTSETAHQFPQSKATTVGLQSGHCQSAWGNMCCAIWVARTHRPFTKNLNIWSCCSCCSCYCCCYCCYWGCGNLCCNLWILWCCADPQGLWLFLGDPAALHPGHRQLSLAFWMATVERRWTAVGDVLLLKRGCFTFEKRNETLNATKTHFWKKQI